MSYNIYIGNAKLEAGCEDNIELYAHWDVEKVEKDDAPQFEGDEFTGKSNGRYPGYTQWSNFCKRVGLYDLFYEDDYALFRPHPGCRPLRQEHLDKFKKALADLNKRDPKPAGLDKRYMDNNFNEEIPEDEETHNYDKVRLIWLIWWTEWALKNCKIAAISNG